MFTVRYRTNFSTLSAGRSASLFPSYGADKLRHAVRSVECSACECSCAGRATGLELRAVETLLFRLEIRTGGVESSPD